jgi:putative ABC transport system ATP-binding protein
MPLTFSTRSIVFSDVSKCIHSGDIDQWIVHDCSGALHEGELVLLVGPSGCGKTTLLSLLSGILSPTKGQINVFGHELTTLSEHDKTVLRRHAMGFIFQNYHLIPTLTAAQNVAIPLLAQGTPDDEALDRAAQTLDTVQMYSYAHHHPNQLSGGQQQRIAIARALVHNPKFILCDEPTAALDEASGQNIMRILKECVSSHHRVVLIVTHDPRIYSYADRMLHMKDGTLCS